MNYLRSDTTLYRKKKYRTSLHSLSQTLKRNYQQILTPKKQSKRLVLGNTQDISSHQIPKYIQK